MLYRQYRPQNFEAVRGQEKTITSLKNAFQLNRLHHAILFCGPRGLGKTTLARIVAKCVNCEKNPMSATPCGECGSCQAIALGNHLDVFEIDAASNRGIEEIRSLKEKINYKPTQGIKKIFVIDEVHMLTTEAFNALLKTLEEPPSYVMFILATTDPEKLPDTILSRCQRFDLESVAYKALEELIDEISKKEKLMLDPVVKELIFERSGGSIRDALTLLEKLMLCSSEGKISQESAKEHLGLVPIERFQFFENILYATQNETVMKFIDELWLEGVDIEDFFKQYTHYLKKLLFSDESCEESVERLEVVLEIIYRLKKEEDKRLLGYVIVQKLRLLKLPKYVKTVVCEASSPIESVLLSQVSIEEISKRWNEVLSHLKRKRISLLAYLSGITLKRFDNAVLEIAFPKGHQLHQQSIELSKNRVFLEEILFEVFNYPIQIETSLEVCELQETDNQLLQTVMEVFGGEIVK